ncbi:MAG: hypothetical protein ACT4P1_10680 [Sporichthyaceae bacterium]
MVALALSLAATAGCSSDGDVDTEPPAAVDAPTTPGPTSSAPSEEQTILAAYREFFARQTEISLAPKEERRLLLEPFTVDPALERVLRGMFAAEEFGEVGYGAPELDPTVASIDGDEATIADCQDTSETGRKKRTSGKITTKGFDEDSVRTTMRRGPDGSWRVSSVDYVDDPC